MRVYVCVFVSKQGCNALIWCLATGRQTCNIFYLPCHRPPSHSVVAMLALCTHTISVCAAHFQELAAPTLQPVQASLPAKRGASLNAASKNQCNPKAAAAAAAAATRASLFVCLPQPPQSVVYYKIHLHRVWAGGWQEYSPHCICPSLCVCLSGRQPAPCCFIRLL